MQVMCCDHVRSLMAPRAFRWSPNTTGNASWRTWMRRCGQHDVDCGHKISSLPTVTTWLIFQARFLVRKTGNENRFFLRRLMAFERLVTILLLNIDPNHPLQAKRVELLGVSFLVQKGSCPTKKGTFLTLY